MPSFTLINVGQFANDQTGDTLRTAMQKINGNFSNLSSIGNLANVAFSFPAGVGSDGQVLTSFGNGSTYWGNVSANGNGSINGVTILPITSPNTGNFTVAHGLTVTPTAVAIQATSAGLIWEQYPVSFDATNLYLTASAANLTATAIMIVNTNNGNSNSAPGSNQEIIFNNAGNFGAATNITTNGTNLSINGSLIINGGPTFGPPAFTTANATPVLNLSTSLSQIVTLTSNVSSSAVINALDGREYTFVIQQGNIGGYTWMWPGNFSGAGNISALDMNAYGNSYSCQKFLWSSTSNIFYTTSTLITVGNV